MYTYEKKNVPLTFDLIQLCNQAIKKLHIFFTEHEIRMQF